MDTDELRRRVDALRLNFHSPFDFGHGIVTKPPRVQRRFQRRLRLMQIPQDLTGKISPAEVGTFDLVFCAGVLYHFRHPLHTLERIRSVTTGTLILETNCLILGRHNRAPLITFFPGDDDAMLADRERFPWHWGAFPTPSWMSYALSAAGFARHDVVYTPSFGWLKRLAAALTGTPQAGRLIIHADANDANRNRPSGPMS